MYRKRYSLLLASITLTGLLLGCVETPKQPVMRPIPPPPPTPPPGVSGTVYMPQPIPGSNVVTQTPPQPSFASTNLQGVEVSSNYVGTAQVPNVAQVQTAQGVPQYEVVPPRPGPDYIWRNGYWRWEGVWAWVPGEWVYQPPSVIIVPDYGWHYYYGPGYYRRPHYHGRW